jgi:(1->4)-alpha-D-glucan 1-alpha-D-glucosylmutase
MTLIKLASPGVPDIYQGNETSDYSLVDPDNRRPVDYERRQRLLDGLVALEKSPRLAEEAKRLAISALDGRAKAWIIWRALGLRRAESDLFKQGDYVPLQAQGDRSEHILAFMRRRSARSVIAVAGRLWMKLSGEENKLPVGEKTWGNTTIDSGPVAGPLQNVLTGETIAVHDGRIAVAEALRSFPAALLIA